MYFHGCLEIEQTKKQMTKGLAEAVPQRCSVKKVLLEISQNPQGNTCARVSFLIKLQACEFYEILRTPFLRKTSGRLLLNTVKNISNSQII